MLCPISTVLIVIQNIVCSFSEGRAVSFASAQKFCRPSARTSLEGSLYSAWRALLGPCGGLQAGGEDISFGWLEKIMITDQRQGLYSVQH